MDFQISALNIEHFKHLFDQDRHALAEQGILRVLVDSNPGYPCRVSLQDAAIGENVLLMNFEHQPMPTPFRSSHAIYVRETARQAEPEKNEIPEMLRHRLLSVRAFDRKGMIIDADVVEGNHVETLFERMLANEDADNLHIHAAKLGCYLGLVKRI